MLPQIYQSRTKFKLIKVYYNSNKVCSSHHYYSLDDKMFIAASHFIHFMCVFSLFSPFPSSLLRFLCIDPSDLPEAKRMKKKRTMRTHSAHTLKLAARITKEGNGEISGKLPSARLIENGTRTKRLRRMMMFT